MAGNASDNIAVLLNNGDGTFAPHVLYSAGDQPAAIVLGDLDGDSDLDLAVANFLGDDLSVFLNNGDGTFAPHVLYAAEDGPSGVAAGDLDGDLDLDLAVANQFDDSVSLFFNNGDGTFAPQGKLPVPYAIDLAIGDLDGDYDLDLAVLSLIDWVFVHRNLGDGTDWTIIVYAVGDTPNYIAMGDLDRDQDLDLVTVNAGSLDASILLNNGDGTFASDVPVDLGSHPGGLALGDLDADFDLDLVVVNSTTDEVLMLPNSCALQACFADLDDNGFVNAADLAQLLGAWGPCNPCCVPLGAPGCGFTPCEACVCNLFSACCDVEWDEVCAFLAVIACSESCDCDCSADITDDGTVNAFDLAHLLGAWGMCP